MADKSARLVLRRFRISPTAGLASSFAKASDYAKASSDKSEDKSNAALQVSDFARFRNGVLE
ncbi:MAG: hypothetical protein JO275_05535 [Verrucomicrobia bacterium]|nr:hypothetical protein [Verrucomicrobiota bacterium]